MITIMTTIAITEFKSKCLAIMRDVEEQHEAVSVEKRGKVIAQIIPVSSPHSGGYGCMSGSVTINGDITEPIEDEWEAMSE
jgi:antitoxin (DNA-binding transcriptional repressor) of toxin-antitoxin stability system